MNLVPYTTMRRREPPEPLELVLYTRADCPLCDAMKAEIGRVRLGGRAVLRAVDIAGDPALEAAYGRSIPVLVIDGRPAFKGRLTAAALERRLERAERARRAAPGPEAG
jgi:Glutaredoxin-like domain (DUF836)